VIWIDLILRIIPPLGGEIIEVESPVDEETKRKQAEMRWLLGQVKKEG